MSCCHSYNEYLIKDDMLQLVTTWLENCTTCCLGDRFYTPPLSWGWSSCSGHKCVKPPPTCHHCYHEYLIKEDMLYQYKLVTTWCPDPTLSQGKMVQLFHIPQWCTHLVCGMQSVELMWNHGGIGVKNKLYNQSTKEVLDEEVIWYQRRSDTVELY